MSRQILKERKIPARDTHDSGTLQYRRFYHAVDETGHPLYPPQFFDIYCNKELAGYSGLLTQRVGTAYQPVFHEKAVINYFGDHPSWALDRTIRYITIPGQDDKGLYHIDYPTRGVADAGYTFFPLLFARPNWDQLGWGLRYHPQVDKFRDFKPSLNTGFSLIEFVTQWRDVIHIYKSWGSISRAATKIREAIAEARKGPTAAARRAANEWLEHQYGTKQFLRDCATIMRIFFSWKRRADEFLADSDATQFKSYQLDTPWLTVGSGWEYVRWHPFGVVEPADCRLAFSHEAIIGWNATLVYRFHLPKMNGFIQRIAQLCDSYGVGLDPSIPWNLIPFSFVIDWFINVGEWLHRQRTDWVNAEIYYAECGRSAKLTYTKQLRFVDGYYPPDYSQAVVTVQHSRYIRSLVTLDGILLPTKVTATNGWGITRTLNAIALSVQQALKHGYRHL